jgi:DNA-binding HxlR family transcriptional regulator
MARASAPASEFPSPGPPTVEMATCPIAASLGTLGRKWTLTILRDIAFFPDASFSLIQKNNPGLLPRTLSLRLKQLSRDGLIVRGTESESDRRPRYRLTAKGQEVWPILATLLQYGTHNHADRVFEDRRPRNIEEVFPNSLGLMLGRFSVPLPRRNEAPRGVD